MDFDLSTRFETMSLKSAISSGSDVGALVASTVVAAPLSDIEL
jgi:hypothetical protein